MLSIPFYLADDLPVDNMLLKRLIFREADSNSLAATGTAGPLSILVERVFEETIFPNMVRTDQWKVGKRHNKHWYINTVADLLVSSLIR